MSSIPLPTKVAAAKTLLEEVSHEHDDLRAGQMVDLQEAIEHLDRLEASFPDEQTDD
ncbi:hypothetical protein [Halalkalicoccus subterraneus]|uniref:hypothetical protein n=1 Tax=Halalkalicoccus subterraneus TaxID=2675002 RepID=UPI0013CEDEDB|nr:hypothetical protein [Halalkalicoccus subterraneus]